MFKVRPAGIKGLGVFATRLITCGTRIFAERPVFGIRHDQGPNYVYPAFQALHDGDRARVLALSAHATRELGLMRWMHVLWYTISTSALPTISGLREHRTLLNIFRGNAFSLNGGSRFAQAIFPQIARLNHECVPNAQANFSDTADAMHVHALRAILPEEEITLSYLDDAGEMSTPERQDRLMSYGFKCGCPICTEGNPLAVQSIARRRAIHEVMRSLSELPPSTEGGVKSRELKALMEIIDLMQAEGLVGRELAARYFTAAQWNHELGNLEGALDCGLRGLEIDKYALGEDHGTCLKDEATVKRYESLLMEDSDTEISQELKAAYA